MDGASGRPISALSEAGPQALDPLWLFDLLRGVTDASQAGSEEVQGLACARFAARVDLGRVAAGVPDDTALPPARSFEELQRLPVDVWIDQEKYVRRIRFEYSGPHGAGGGVTAEWFDFGTPRTIDWSRLPRLKPPSSPRTATVRSRLAKLRAAGRSWRSGQAR